MGESLAWRIKVYLQWTGWLQYVPNMVFLLLVGLLIYLFKCLDVSIVVVLLDIVFVVALFTLCFDLITVKFNFRPQEAIPPRRDHLDAFDLMLSRRSCRSFQWRDLTQEHRSEILDAVKAWTHPGKLLGSKAVRFEYIREPLRVWPVVGCHEFLVAIAPKDYDRVAILDVGRSLQKVVLHATRMGVATCWIGPGADHKSVVAKMGNRFDEAKDHIICVCAIGYPSWYIPTAIALIVQRIQRWRYPVQSLFYADAKFKNPLPVEEAPFNRFGRSYEACRWSPSSFNAQPVRCVGEAKGQRFDFYGANQSRYYTPVAVGIWLANWETGCEALQIKGRFKHLQLEEIDVKALQSDGPVYDMSWICDV